MTKDTQNNFTGFDILIIIILALLVAFIIGFNIIQTIDNKLGSVVINVPPYENPNIYVSLNQDGTFERVQPLINQESKETFGNLPQRMSYNEVPNITSQQVSSNLASDIINTPDDYATSKDKNYNTVNNLPLLITPDPLNPNQSTTLSKPYYTDRIKLVNNPDSPLLKLAEKNKSLILNTINKCSIKELDDNISSDKSYEGYNAYVDLRKDSYANVTSIGKNLITPYVSLPVAS